MTMTISKKGELSEVLLVRRNILMIIPKKPHWEWVNSLCDISIFPDDFCNYNTYLLDLGIDDLNLDHHLECNFEFFFQEELYQHWADESDWPKERNFDLFQEWFGWRFSSRVWDLSGRSEKHLQ